MIEHFEIETVLIKLQHFRRLSLAIVLQFRSNAFKRQCFKLLISLITTSQQHSLLKNLEQWLFIAFL